MSAGRRVSTTVLQASSSTTRTHHGRMTLRDGRTGWVLFAAAGCRHRFTFSPVGQYGRSEVH